MSKIPDQAKPVFKGVIFDVYQWQQELYDGSTETFEMLKRPDTVVIIPVTAEGRVVLIEQEQPKVARHLAVPAGRVDTGEEPLTAAQRELAEETGYTDGEWELWYSHQPYRKIEWTVWFYLARNVRKMTEQHLDAGEKIDVQDRSVGEFLDSLVAGDLKIEGLGERMMRDLLAGKREELINMLYRSEENL